jgi:hypothetical protein
VALTQWSNGLSVAQFWSWTERTSSRKNDDSFIFQLHKTLNRKYRNCNEITCDRKRATLALPLRHFPGHGKGIGTSSMAEVVAS